MDITKKDVASGRPSKTLVNSSESRDHPSALQVQRLNFVSFLEFIREMIFTISNISEYSIRLHLLYVLHDVKGWQSPVLRRE